MTRLYLIGGDGTVNTGLEDGSGALQFANIEDLRYYAAIHGEPIARVGSVEEGMAVVTGLRQVPASETLIISEEGEIVSAVSPGFPWWMLAGAALLFL